MRQSNYEPEELRKHVNDIPPQVIDAWNSIANDPKNRGISSDKIRDMVIEQINNRHVPKGPTYR